MKENEVLDLFSQTKAVITQSHIVYTSGKHGSAYVNKDAIYPHTQETSQLCRALAELFTKQGVEVVIAPVMGGVILSQWIAHHLSELTGEEVLGVYAEKGENQSFLIQRGYDRLIQGKKVLVVEDILNTGGSVKKVVEVVRQTGGEVVGVGALCNRGGVTAKEIGDVPIVHSLVEIKLEAWEADECPLCAQKIPINTTVGKGKEFLKKQH